MTQKLKRGRLGNIPQERDPRDYPYPFLLSTLKLPNEVINLDIQAPIWNQGNFGACTQFAAGSVVAAQHITEGTYFGELAHMATYNMACFLQGWLGQDNGSTNRTTCKVFTKFGYTEAAAFPYTKANFGKKPAKAWLTAAEKRMLNEKQYFAVGSSNAFSHQGVKSALANMHGVIVGFPVYESFFNAGKTGVVMMPKRGEQEEGGHAMALVGYSEKKKAYLGRQSWGKGWGLKDKGFDGYCWFPFEFAEQYMRDCHTIVDVK